MVIVKPENYFFVCNGQVLKDLGDLLSFLKKIDDETLRYHFNENRNDFCPWLTEILREENLAKRMSHLKTRKELVEAIESKMKTKSKKSSKGNIISQIKNAVING